MFGDLERSRSIAYTAVFIGLIAIGGWISVPFIPSPFTLQTFFVLLAGAVMKRRAVIPVALYVLFGAAGLPVFHNGTAGIGILLGPTGGYFAGFIAAALVAGLAYESPRPAIRIAGLVAGAVLILACGVAWLIVSTGMAPVAAVVLGMLIFLPGDLVKAGAAYLVAQHLP
jgi:Uncharacterized conserved protein